MILNRVDELNILDEVKKVAGDNEIIIITGYTSAFGLAKIANHFSNNKLSVYSGTDIINNKNFNELKINKNEEFVSVESFQEFPKNFDNLIKKISDGDLTFYLQKPLKSSFENHAKAFFIKEENSYIAFIGSGNLTVSGLQKHSYTKELFTKTKITKEEFESYMGYMGAEDDGDYQITDLTKEILTYMDKGIILEFEQVWEDILGKLPGVKILNKQSVDKYFEINKTMMKVMTKYQLNGFSKSLNMLQKYGGSILCFSVGLGKTLAAAAIVDYYWRMNKQKAVIVTPVNIKDDWSKYSNNTFKKLDDNGEEIELTVECKGIAGNVCSYHEFLTDKDMIDKLKECKLLVIDEAHNFRNDSNRKERLEQILKAVGNDLNVLLVTATPINNSLKDLVSLYSYLGETIEHDEDDPISPAYIGRVDNLNELIKEKKETLQEEDWNEQVVIAKNHILTTALKIENQDDFPRLNVVNKNIYSPDKKDEAYSIISSICQRIDSVTFSPKADPFIKNMFKHWLESSPSAFISTLENARAKRTSKAFKDWINPDIPTSHEEEYKLAVRYSGKNDFEPDQEDINGIKMVLSIFNKPETVKVLDEIISYAEELSVWEYNNKYSELKEITKKHLDEGRKILVFTESVETGQKIFDGLIKDNDGVGFVSGTQLQYKNKTIFKEEKQHVLKAKHMFSPGYNSNKKIDNWTPPKEGINLLITTDVLSEGHNLQDGTVVINFDIHYNPVRVVQRIGRTYRYLPEFKRNNKIANQNFVYNFFIKHEDMTNKHKTIHWKSELADKFGAETKLSFLEGPDGERYKKELLRKIDERKLKMDSMENDEDFVSVIEKRSKGESIEDMVIDDQLSLQLDKQKRIKTKEKNIDFAYSYFKFNKLEKSTNFLVMKLKIKDPKKEQRNKLKFWPYIVVEFDDKGNNLSNFEDSNWTLKTFNKLSELYKNRKLLKHNKTMHEDIMKINLSDTLNELVKYIDQEVLDELEFTDIFEPMSWIRGEK